MLYTQIFPLEKEKDIERYSSLNIFCAFFSFELIRLAAAADIFARVGIVLHSSFPARKKEERLTAFFWFRLDSTCRGLGCGAAQVDSKTGIKSSESGVCRLVEELLLYAITPPWFSPGKILERLARK